MSDPLFACTTFFVLRHGPSGNLFPRCKDRDNISYLEFTDDLLPRLFPRAQDALHAARHWCKGYAWRKTRHWADDSGDPFDMHHEPVEGRILEELEIVPVVLIRAPQSEIVACHSVKR